MSGQYARYRDANGRTVRVQANTTFRGSPMRTRQSQHYWQGDSYVPSGWYPVDFNTWLFLAAVSADDYSDTDVQPEALYQEVGAGYNTDTGYAEQSVSGDYGQSSNQQSSDGYYPEPQQSYSPPVETYSPPPTSYEPPSYGGGDYSGGGGYDGGGYSG